MMIARRDVFKLVGAGLSAVAAAFPKTAVIRTVLKDLPPEALGAGATLFHEHMSLAPDFMPRWIALARGGRAAPSSSRLRAFAHEQRLRMPIEILGERP